MLNKASFSSKEVKTILSLWQVVNREIIKKKNFFLWQQSLSGWVKDKKYENMNNMGPLKSFNSRIPES